MKAKTAFRIRKRARGFYFPSNRTKWIRKIEPKIEIYVKRKRQKKEHAITEVIIYARVNRRSNKINIKRNVIIEIHLELPVNSRKSCCFSLEIFFFSLGRFIVFLSFVRGHEWLHDLLFFPSFFSIFSSYEANNLNDTKRLSTRPHIRILYEPKNEIGIANFGRFR